MSAQPSPGLPEVVLYRTRHCGYCVMAARLLTSHGIPFREVDVSGDAERRRWLLSATGQYTVPQIFVGTRSIGGYQELSALLRGGRAALEKLAGEPDAG